MGKTTTIQVERSTKKDLDKIGHKGQTYNEIIKKLANQGTDNKTTDEGGTE